MNSRQRRVKRRAFGSFVYFQDRLFFSNQPNKDAFEVYMENIETRVKAAFAIRPVPKQITATEVLERAKLLTLP